MSTPRILPDFSVVYTNSFDLEPGTTVQSGHPLNLKRIPPDLAIIFFQNIERSDPCWTVNPYFRQ